MGASVTRAFAGLSALLLAAPACTVPYQPLQARLDGVAADAFAHVAAAVSGSYGRLAVADPASFRIQSSWVFHDRRGVAGQKRATVFVDDGDRVNVVVETRYLALGLFGDPAWSSIVGDSALERELLAAVVQALGST